jgi:hypothetical protein
MTKRICVTGASGRARRVTAPERLVHGYRVVATDRALGFIPQHSWRDHVAPRSS